MDRNELVAAKTAETLAVVSAWARDTGLLEPGEELRVELTITNRAAQDSNPHLDMTIRQFFTRERFEEVDSGFGRRAVTALYVYGNPAYFRAESSATMRDFLRDESRASILRTDQIGPKLAGILIRGIEAAGLQLKT